MCKGGDKEGGGSGEAGQGAQQPIRNLQVKAEEYQMSFGVVELITLERVGGGGKRWKREGKTGWRASCSPPRPSQTSLWCRKAYRCHQRQFAIPSIEVADISTASGHIEDHDTQEEQDRGTS